MTKTSVDADARRALQKRLAEHQCAVHQPDDPPLFSREPRSTMRSHHWRSADLMPLLDELGSSIDLGAGGPRRTLRLVSPGLASGTTPTFWASIQVILPGEIADAHRHSANAFRFIMQGQGASTTVDGERFPMEVGDLVLTPAWSFHDHDHRGTAPMIWLDVLDIPLMHALHATFFEPAGAVVQGVEAVADRSSRLYGSGLLGPTTAWGGHRRNPLLAYPWRIAERALLDAAPAQSDAVDDTLLEYRNPLDGGAALTTMGLALQRLRPGVRAGRKRHTGSKLFYVVRGTGTANVGDDRFAWSAGDLFTVAPWTWHALTNDSANDDAVLFQVNDFPTLRSLGFWKEEREDAAR